MMILLAFPQPWAPPVLPLVTSAARAETACSSSIEPRLRPSRPDPPTRRMSRRVMPSCGSHRSFPACPGTMIIVSLLVWGSVDRELSYKASWLPHCFSHSMIEQERRAVDQGPGDVLGRRQPAGGRLLDAQLQVVSQLEQYRIDGHRALGLLEQAAQRHELGINRQRGLAGVHRVNLLA